MCYLKEDKTQAQDTNSSNADSEDIDKKYYGVFIHIASGMANILEFYRLSYKSEFDWVVDEGSFLMPWFTYNKSGGEGDFWDTAYWNYVNLSI